MIKWLVRIGCAIGILVIVTVGGLVLAGGGRHIAHAQTSVTFKYPAAQIWPWIVEPSRLKQWLVGFVDTVRDDPSAGLKLGARSTEIVQLDGRRRWEIRSQVTALEPPHRIGLHMSAAEFEDDTVYELSEQGGVTVVTYKSDAHYTQLFARLLSPIICHDVERKMQADLGKLDKLLASTPALYTPPPPPGKSAIPGCCAAEPAAPAPTR